MTEPWIRGCVVQRIRFRGGLVLNLDDNELVISVPFHLTLPATDRDDEEAVLIDPKAARAEERALFDFAGSTCTHASWDEDGSLHLGFSDGHEIHAHSDERAHRVGALRQAPRLCGLPGARRGARRQARPAGGRIRRALAVQQCPHLGEPEQTLAPGNRLIGLHLVGDELGAILLGQPTGPRRRPNRAPPDERLRGSRNPTRDP